MQALLMMVVLTTMLQGQAPPVRVLLTTDAGAIEIEVDAARAPITDANFLKYV
jgi:hypothetical protein